MSPTTPARACPGCGRLHRAGEACPQATARRATYERQRGTAASRGYDSHWRIVRAAFIKAHPQCCEPGCGERTYDVDHIDGNAKNNKWDNLRPYCHRHHSARTSRDQGFGAARRGRSQDV